MAADRRLARIHFDRFGDRAGLVRELLQGELKLPRVNTFRFLAEQPLWADRSKRMCPGRPSTDASIRSLLDETAVANPLWGAPRIHGALRKLGIEVSERTVSRLLRRRPRPPSQTWRTFLTNHVAAVVPMDFFTVPTLTGRLLFVLVLLSHERRRIVHLACPSIDPAA